MWKFVAATTVGAALVGIAYWYRRPVATWQKADSQENLLRNFLPKAEFTGEVSIVIHAPPEAISSAIRRVALSDMPLANWLGQLRYLPRKLAGKDEAPKQVTTQPFIKFLQDEGGNIVLAEVPNRELIFGAIGKFHQFTDQSFVPLHTPQDFIEFSDPDYQKLAMSFVITPLSDGTAARLSLIHGTHALSDRARRNFALYWLFIKPGGNFVSWCMLRAIKALAEASTVPSAVAR